jgi:protein-tyrosine phosphatase
MSNISWIQIGQGFISIGHIPGGKISFTSLKEAGTSVVVTLLQEHEGVRKIGEQLKQMNIEWIWFPFSATNPHSGKKKTREVLELFSNMNELLENGNRIYIHCSAGIHRTGMITYGLLRYLGKEKEQAIQLLNMLRVVTVSSVGENRLIWGDQFFHKIPDA